mgnify:CR=1 FL=1
MIKCPLDPASILSLTLVQNHSDAVGTDLCLNPSESQLAKHMTPGAAPKLGTDAGHFSYVKGNYIRWFKETYGIQCYSTAWPFSDVSDFSECVTKCCGNPDCNSVFYSQSKCFTISCLSDDACSPAKKSLDSVLINMRPVSKWLTVSHNYPVFFSLTVFETRTMFPADQTSDRELSTLQSMPSRHESGGEKRACELDLVDCPPNQECVPNNANSRVRNGVCQCKKGFTRVAGSQDCRETKQEDKGTGLNHSMRILMLR